MDWYIFHDVDTLPNRSNSYCRIYSLQSVLYIYIYEVCLGKPVLPLQYRL